MKIIKNITVLIILGMTLSFHGCNESNEKTEDALSRNLDQWLAKAVDKREPLESLEFAKEPLTKNRAAQVTELLYADKQERLVKDYGSQWDNGSLSFGGYTMPFYYNIFGDQPSGGRSLFISLHGGGGTTAEMNDQQYNNQKHLYDAAMENLEGVYLAPRAPTNTWDLWHQDHIDELMNIIIQMAVIKLNVNPDKVYLLGYSAGGDGVYQLAPRMADRWAAASMMAGHPNDASPLGLRNTPFALHVGALDDPYDRNRVAGQWGEELDNLRFQDPQGYVHDVQIHEGMGHWMELKDAVALAWMKNYRRNPIPEKVVWKQDNRHHKSFYWLGAPENKIKDGDKIVAEYNANLNEINILENSGDHVQLLINDDMLNLDEPVTIKYQGNVIAKKVFARSILNTYQSMNHKGDPKLSFPCIISVINNEEIQE